MVTKTNHISG